VTETPEPVAVILAAHGDRGGATPNAALRAHAEAVGRLTGFPILPGVLKGDPSIESALESARTQRAARVIVYPMFMADGYFVHKLRERIAAVALTPKPDILAPLGLDPALPDVLVAEAATIAEARGASPNFGPQDPEAEQPGVSAAPTEHPQARERKTAETEETISNPVSAPKGPGATRPGASAAPAERLWARERKKLSSRLLIVGHGSKLGPASASATRKAAARAAITRRFASVTTAFLEEEPFLEDILRASAATPTVVAGFFFGDGLHAGEDVPDAIAEAGANALYTGAIGNSPAVAPLIAAALKTALSGRGD